MVTPTICEQARWDVPFVHAVNAVSNLEVLKSVLCGDGISPTHGLTTDPYALFCHRYHCFLRHRLFAHASVMRTGCLPVRVLMCSMLFIVSSYVLVFQWNDWCLCIKIGVTILCIIMVYMSVCCSHSRQPTCSPYWWFGFVWVALCAGTLTTISWWAPCLQSWAPSPVSFLCSFAERIGGCMMCTRGGWGVRRVPTCDRHPLAIINQW